MKKLIGQAVLMAVGVFSACLVETSAEAHSVSSRHRHWHLNSPKLNLDLQSEQTVTPFCDGKYENMAKELNRENLLGHINLYRVHAGLPKLKPQTYRSTFSHYGYHTRKDTRLRDALLLLERRQTHLSVEAETDYLNAIDLATGSGPTLDWWLKTETFKKKDHDYGCHRDRPGNPDIEIELCGYQLALSDSYRSSAGFDWLMSDHQMEKAEAYWFGTGIKYRDEVKTIFNHIDQQSEARPGINIWMAQYEHHKLFEHSVPDSIKLRAAEAVTDILTCQAGPSVYGIIAKGDLGLPHDYLPKILAERRTRRDIHRLTFDTVQKGQGLDQSYHWELNQMVERLEGKGWAAGFQTLSAPDLESLKSYALMTGNYDLPGTQAQLLFSLPAEHIPDSFSNVQMAHALTEGKTDLGLRTAASILEYRRKDLQAGVENARRRYNDNKDYNAYYAREYKSRLQKAEAQLKIFNDTDILSSDLPDPMKLTLAALFGQVSHNIDPHHRDVYKEQTNEMFLNIYLRRRLFPGTRYPHFHWRARSYYSVPEAYLKGERSPQSEAFNLRSLRKNDGTPETGFAAFVDWNKLPALVDENRLTRTIAVNVINWLDQATPQDRTRHADLMAQALYDVIRMCRHEDAGDLNGAPVQKRAFERLHKYYGKSDQAKRTKYWWGSRGRHGKLPL